MKHETLLNLHSNRLAKLYEDSNYCDMSIVVSDDAETAQQTFTAHSAILVAQSQYFAVALSDAWVKRDPKKWISFKKPNIKPKIFEILLKYMYSGQIDLKDHNVQTLLCLLVAADELVLEDLVDFIQDYLLAHHFEPNTNDFTLIERIALEHSNFTKLQEFNIDSRENKAVKFQQIDFTTLQETDLISLLKQDNLNIPEIEIWKKILDWGINKVIESSEDALSIPIDKWTQPELNQLKYVLEKFVSHIHFFHINSVEFHNKILPYSRLLPETLIRDLLHHHLVPGSQAYQEKLYPARGPNSAILTHEQIIKIIEWIKKNDSKVNDKVMLKLLLRGSRDGFTPSDFHFLCDKKGPTIVAIHVKDTNEIFGGYNPLEWNSFERSYEGLESFLFKFDPNDPNGSNGVLSKYVRSWSIDCKRKSGPCFGAGYDLALNGKDFRSHENNCYYYSNDTMSSYVPRLINSKKGHINFDRVSFSIVDYEVFQVLIE